MTSLYDLLEVKADASGESIRTAFRGLALIHHPDKSNDPDSDKIFKDISNAYQVLSNDDLRTCYNVFHDPDASRLAELIDQAQAMFPGMELISALQILHIIVGGPVVETTEVKGKVIKSYDILTPFWSCPRFLSPVMTRALELAQACERAGQFDRMRLHVEEVIAALPRDTELSFEELDLLEIALKNSIAPKRRSWRVIVDEERHQSGIGNERLAALARSEKISAELELVEILGHGLDRTKDLLGRTLRLRSQIVLQKIKGDLSRYLAEIYMARGSEAREQVIEIAQQAKLAFDSATELSREFDVTDPLRLSVSLHYSLFTHEILGRPKQACFIARDAFAAGSAQLGSITNESSQKKSAHLLQLLRDNLCLWTSSRVP